MNLNILESIIQNDIQIDYENWFIIDWKLISNNI